MVGMRFYFDWANYRTMLRLLREEPNPAMRRKMYGAFLVGVPMIAAIHALCFALDPILFPSLRRTQVRSRRSVSDTPEAGPPICIG
jgi:omega-hydroxy-beta-dihydromenaquinone-9 sulfotransferase